MAEAFICDYVRTSIELGRLKTPFRTPRTVTAGNASGVNYGAAALILASEGAVRRHGLTPRGCIVAMAVAGVEPHHGYRARSRRWVSCWRRPAGRWSRST